MDLSRLGAAPLTPVLSNPCVLNKKPNHRLTAPCLPSEHNISSNGLLQELLIELFLGPPQTDPPPKHNFLKSGLFVAFPKSLLFAWGGGGGSVWGPGPPGVASSLHPRLPVEPRLHGLLRPHLLPAPSSFARGLGRWKEARRNVRKGRGSDESSLPNNSWRLYRALGNGEEKGAAFCWKVFLCSCACSGMRLWGKQPHWEGLK